MTAPDTPSREMEERAVEHVRQWGGAFSTIPMMIEFTKREIALRLPAKPADDDVREACEKIATQVGFVARCSIRAAKGPIPRAKAIGGEETAQEIQKQIRALSTKAKP